MPLSIAALIEGVAMPTIAIVAAVAAAYLLFWVALAVLVGRLHWTSAADAAMLAAAWLVPVLIVPTLGHVSIGARVAAYRAGLEARDAAGRSLGWLLPSVGVQGLLTRLAHTDLQAQLAYQDRIRAFHARLRGFYYGYLFHDRPFAGADFDRAPMFGTPD
ncbi:MAG: DUF3526 domain-containing protein [Sphingomonas fennica]